MRSNNLRIPPLTLIRPSFQWESLGSWVDAPLSDYESVQRLCSVFVASILDGTVS